MEDQGGPTRDLDQRVFFFGVNWLRTIHLQRVEKYRSQNTIRMILIEQIQVFATVLLGYKRKEKEIHINMRTAAHDY